MPKVTAEHAQARRRQILDAAVRCFAAAGFHGTTMQDIVREAGLSPGAIYSYFPSKSALVEEIVRERHAAEATALQAAAAEPDPRAAVRALATTFFGSLEDPEQRLQRRVGVEMWAEALRNPSVHRLVESGLDRPRAALAELTRDAQAEGRAPPGLDPDAAARAMIAVFHGFVLQQAWDDDLEVEPYLATVEAALDALLRYWSDR